jgi:predicted transcriptional regulator
MLNIKVDPNKVEELSAEFSRLSRTIEDGEVEINKQIKALLRETLNNYSEHYVCSRTSQANNLLNML